MTPDPSTFKPPERFNIADYFLDARIREGKGDAVALHTDYGPLTYREVQVLANQFGHLLREAGVQPEQRVLLALPDSPDFVGALFGTLKIGAVAVMVNPHLRPDAIAYFLDYTRATVALIYEEDLAAFEEPARQARALRELIVIDDTFDDRSEAMPIELENYPTHRDDPAIWLFSGGTSGRPKAAVQPHGSYANSTECYGKGVLGYTARDITISVPKLFFGYALGSNLLFPFAVGAAAVLFPERCTPAVLFQKIAQFRPTILVNVPTMVQQMVQHAEQGGLEEAWRESWPRSGPESRPESGPEPRLELRLELQENADQATDHLATGATDLSNLHLATGATNLSSLRLATSAGEALPAGLHERWRQLFGIDLLDGLGTAEMWHVFISNRPGQIRPGTLGSVVPGFEVRVADDDGVELPPGEVGFLWVRGKSRALGYWQRLEQSKRAFRGEWYVSEDMLSRDEHGYFTYHGRADDMLKISGKWLAPQEVENCLLRHPAVRECAVVGVTDEAGLTRTCAYLVLAGEVEERGGEGAVPGAPTDMGPGKIILDSDLAESLQSFARAHLESYKVPRELVFLETMPRTHLGKVDRGRLRGATAGH